VQEFFILINTLGLALPVFQLKMPKMRSFLAATAPQAKLSGQSMYPSFDHVMGMFSQILTVVSYRRFWVPSRKNL
jgi:hypothetical protein